MIVGRCRTRPRLRAKGGSRRRRRRESVANFVSVSAAQFFRRRAVWIESAAYAAKSS